MSIRESIAQIIRDTFPDLFLRGVFRFVVHKHEDGKLSVIPDRARWLDDIPLAEIWPGLAGYTAQPAEGSGVLIAFADGDQSRPVVVGFQPLGSTGGKPIRSTIDASEELKLCDGAATVLRVGDKITITPGNGSGVVSGLIALDPSGPAPSKVKA